MIYNSQRLFNKIETTKKMHYFIAKYYKDLRNFHIVRNGKRVPLLSLTVKQFFDFVRKIPYRQDKKPIEVVARPKHILNSRRIGMDCKKKSVLIASYLKNRKIPYRLIGSSIKSTRRIHHIFPQACFSGDWKNLDATYNHNKIFEPKKVTSYELL
jgi:hypothetical protein